MTYVYTASIEIRTLLCSVCWTMCTPTFPTASGVGPIACICTVVLYTNLRESKSYTRCEHTQTRVLYVEWSVSRSPQRATYKGPTTVRSGTVAHSIPQNYGARLYAPSMVLWHRPACGARSRGCTSAGLSYEFRGVSTDSTCRETVEDRVRSQAVRLHDLVIQNDQSSLPECYLGYEG